MSIKIGKVTICTAGKLVFDRRDGYFADSYAHIPC